MNGAPPDAPRRVAASNAWRHRFAVGTAASTLLLIVAGALVTSTGSGLAVPDWPLSYGMLMPPMVGGVFYEHGHRMVASAVGLLTLILAIWTWRAEPRRGVRRLAAAALAAVVLQGVLGGLTVLYLLPTPVSVAHACLAQAFFCGVVALAYATSGEWRARGARAVPDDVHGLRAVTAAAAAAVFVQLLLGALMRHTGAGLAVPDFPLSFGHVVPPFWNAAVAVHFAHRAFALVVLATVLAVVVRARRHGDPRFVRLAAVAAGLVLAQVGLGAATVLTGKAVAVATAHVATGAALLGACWLLALRVRRLTRPRAGARGVVLTASDRPATA
jgi:cytochrome c oxidase assembly protein subunit 15